MAVRQWNPGLMLFSTISRRMNLVQARPPSVIDSEGGLNGAQ